MDKQEKKDHSAACRELATRCRPGSVVYLMGVLIVLSCSPQLASKVWFPILSLSVFGVLAFFRYKSARAIEATRGCIDDVMKRRFDLLAGLNGILYGTFSAYAIFESGGWQRWLFLFLTVTISVGSASSMAPNFKVFASFNIGLLLPSIVVLLLGPRDQDTAAGWMMFGLAVLGLWMGRVQNRNYWDYMVKGRRQLEELTLARNRLEMVVSGSNLGGFDWNLESQEMFVDRKVAETLGYPSSKFDPYTGDWSELIFSEDKSALRTIILGNLKNPNSPLCAGEVRLRAADGEQHWYSFRGRVVERGPNGRALRMSGTCEDITLRKNSESVVADLRNRVEQAEKLKTLGVLAGGVAHDFNNLLTAFIGNIELAELDTPEDWEAKEYLSQARRAALDASELCNQLLAYAGKGQFLIETFCLNQMVEDLTHLLQVSIGRNLELQLELEPHLPPLEADVSQIRQVVLNLMTNASESMEGQQGVISLRTSVVSGTEARRRHEELEEKNYVCLEVTDQGCGMDDETAEKIFDPFFTTKFTGRGLGLASVLGIARSHAGAIEVDSTPGQGTTFRLLLPGRSAPLMKNVAEDSGMECEAMKILVVDDEEGIRKLTSRMLTQVGHEVVLAEDGFVALEQLERCNDLALVVLDLTMPRKDGYETLIELRQRWPEMPVLLSSGYSEDAVVQKAQTRIQGFLKKPFTRDLLLREVSRLGTLRPNSV